MDKPEEVLASIRDAMAAQDFARAEGELKAASRRWKNEPEFSVRHANVLVMMGRDSEALKVYRKVMKKAPERLDACQGAAQCALAIGKSKLAEKLFNRAVGLGIDLEEAALGIARCLLQRRLYLDAWKKAETQFKQGGNRHRGLYELLQEISPQVGIPVPRFDEFDSVSLNQIQDEIRRDSPDLRLATHSYSAGSIEAMAGVDRKTLVDGVLFDDEELLNIRNTGKGTTNLGIDLSFMGTTSASGQDITDTASMNGVETLDSEHQSPTPSNTHNTPVGESDLDLDAVATDSQNQNRTEDGAHQSGSKVTSSVESGVSDDPWDDWP